MPYYVISLLNSQKREAFLTLWRHHGEGYTYSRQQAGKYEEPPKNDALSYAVPEDVLEPLWYAMPPGEISHRLRNDPATLKALGLSWKAGRLTKK